MDNHPEKLEFEIDREGLRRSLRAGFLIAWGSLFGLMMILVVLFAVPRGLEAGLSSGLKVFAWGTVSTALISSIGYFGFTVRTLQRAVQAVSLKVDGPYLLVQSYDIGSRSWHDRKLHFKSIVDYGIMEDSHMRRYGVKALKLTTLSGGISSNVLVPAVRNCHQVRDLLAEIDLERENHGT